MDLFTGELAKMFNPNKQTSFYRDREGLLVPKHRDKQTGYREYRFEQIYRFALICYLRKIGFSIDQIRGYTQNGTLDMCICELKRQSQELRKAYEEIPSIDDVIRREIFFVEHKMYNMKQGEVSQRYYLKRAYLPLGMKESIYTKEGFYLHPTIAFYTYREDRGQHETTFGVYLETLGHTDPAVADQVQYTEKQKFLCVCWKGSYIGIGAKIKELRQEYGYLGLSSDTYNSNIVDQFLEKDMEEYITKAQTPITGISQGNQPEDPARGVGQGGQLGKPVGEAGWGISRKIRPPSSTVKVKTTGLAGGLFCPYKGLLPACARKAH